MVASCGPVPRSSRSSSKKRGTAGSSRPSTSLGAALSLPKGRKRPVRHGVEMPAVLDSYVAEAERVGAGLGRTAPEWLTRARRDGLARFQTLGFPTTHDEEWRFTSVAPIADGHFEF